MPICNLDKTVVHHVRRWTAEGRWVDLGQWVEGDRRGDVFYKPTPEEIAHISCIDGVATRDRSAPDSPPATP